MLFRSVTLALSKVSLPAFVLVYLSRLPNEKAVMADIKNITPAFYQRHHHGRYYWWDLSLKNVQRIYAGAKINLESTRTQLSGGVESIQNYVFFNGKGLPEQSSKNIQVVSARIKQDIMYRAFGWENEVAYQLSSEKSQLPLPL